MKFLTFNKTFTKILITLLLILLIIWFLSVYKILDNSYKKFFFIRIIEPTENISSKYQSSFKNESNLADKNYYQDWCHKNYTQNLNSERLRDTFGIRGFNDHGKDYLGYNYIATSITYENDSIVCNAHKTIDTTTLTKPIIQVFTEINDEYYKGMSKEEICRFNLKLLDKTVNDKTKINILELTDTKNLIICEIKDL